MARPRMTALPRSEQAGDRSTCRPGEGGAADVLKAASIVVPAEPRDRADDRFARLADLVFLPAPHRWAVGVPSLFPSIPTDAHVSHSRTTSASVVDGHSARGADSQRAANTDSSAARRLRYGHPAVSARFWRPFGAPLARREGSRS